MNDRARLGRRGEDLAVEHLRARGYRILDRNVRTRFGELDIVAKDGECIVFVEVRTVRSGGILPEESITLQKERRVAALAQRYLQEHAQEDVDWRVDVVAIEMGKDGRVARIEHHESALEQG